VRGKRDGWAAGQGRELRSTGSLPHHPSQASRAAPVAVAASVAALQTAREASRAEAGLGSHQGLIHARPG